jgi:hypothetical protein
MGACLWVFGFQTAMTLEARYWALKKPGLWKIPTELSDQSVSQAPGRTLSYLGYKFEVPWEDLDEGHTKLVAQWQFIAFKSGRVIVLKTTPANDLLREMPFANWVLQARFGRVPQHQAEFAVVQIALASSPAEITPLMSKRAVEFASILLFLKSAFMLDSDSRPYSIRTPTFRGFQYERAVDGGREIRDDLYSDQGNVELIFRSGSSSRIKQADIDRVLQTLRPLPRRADTRIPAHAETSPSPSLPSASRVQPVQ